MKPQAQAELRIGKKINYLCFFLHVSGKCCIFATYKNAPTPTLPLMGGREENKIEKKKNYKLTRL